MFKKNRQKFKGRIFDIQEFWRITDMAMFSAIRRHRQLALIDRNFRSHIMLAVTEVNGCKYCSYLHTKQALASGSSAEQLTAFSCGKLDLLDPQQVPALLFAQHYADVSGSFDEEAYASIEKEYGVDRAQGILAAIRMISFGNANGIALTLLMDRLKGIRYEDSRFLTDLTVFVGPVLMIPVLLIRNLFPRRMDLPG